jgi:Tfp pilus assembly protein PilN
MTLPPVTSSPPPSLASQAMAAAGRPTVPPRGARQPLNLARRPFVNTRPVTRVALFLWIGGVLLLALNVGLFWSYLRSSEQERSALADAEAATERARRAVLQLDDRLAGLNLDKQNREVAYLNRKIAERVFSWSLLFDRLSEVLPDGVRVVHLTPQGLGGREVSPSGTPLRQEKRDVTIVMGGDAKSNEALLQFIDRLFAHHSFSEPDLMHQDRTDDGLIHFEAKVQYLPDVPLRSTVPPAATPRPGSTAGPAGNGLPSASRGVTRRAPGVPR